MVLSETEREGFRDILGKLLEEDLKSLALTVVRNRLSKGTKAVAVNVVLNHSESAAGLLGRRAIRKEILVEYLKDNNVVVKNLPNHEIVEKILEFWKLTSDAAPEDAGAIAGAMEGVGNLSIQETESVSDSKQDLPSQGRSRDAK